MIIRKAEFYTTAVEPHQYPPPERYEIAMAGRSNVGKSSLINAMLNRKALAYVGNTPGKTRVVNFYHINDDLALVDLAGYGYAKVSRELQKSWAPMVEHYLQNRESLFMVLLLVDSRHEPTPDDVQMANWLRGTGRRFAVIATKVDKIGRQQIKEQLDIIRKTLLMMDNEVLIAVSAEKKTGIPELWNLIDQELSSMREEET